MSNFLELPSSRGLNLLVIGEVVLDRYLWGTVERISPEAPIPVLHQTHSEERLGNAAFVAACVQALGGQAHLLSITGTDLAGSAVRRLAEGMGICCDSLLERRDRLTIVKERLLGASQSAKRGVQQMLRVDREDSTPLDRTSEEALLAQLDREIELTDGILICDINKGLLTARLLNEIISRARLAQKPVIVDPRLTEEFLIYRGATAITPNRFEAQRATGLDLTDSLGWPAAAERLIEQCDLAAILVTLDRDGMFFAERNGTTDHIETTPREVYDVTGAGDVVLAVFGLLWAAGCRPIEAARMANLAASLEVTRQGATVISRSELVNALREPRGTSRKIRSLEEIRGTLVEHRQRGRNICLMEGNFELDLQSLQLLEFAHTQGDILVVAIRTAAGAPCPGVTCPERRAADQAQLLAALEMVDYVLVSDDPGPSQIVKAIQPDVFVATDDTSSSDSTGIGSAAQSNGTRTIFARLTTNGFSLTGPEYSRRRVPKEAVPALPASEQDPGLDLPSLSDVDFD